MHTFSRLIVHLVTVAFLHSDGQVQVFRSPASAGSVPCSLGSLLFGSD
jgi:hypothetical protein